MSRSTAKTAALVAAIALALVLGTRFGSRAESNPTHRAAAESLRAEILMRGRFVGDPEFGAVHLLQAGGGAMPRGRSVLRSYDV